MLIDVIEKQIHDIWSTILQYDNFGKDDAFFEVGGDSKNVIELTILIAEEYPDIIETNDLFAYPTIRQLSRFIYNRLYNSCTEIMESNQSGTAKGISTEVVTDRCDKAGNDYCKTLQSNSKDVAVIGFAGRFPNAENVNLFWENLINGDNAISEIPSQRFALREETYCKWGGFLSSIEMFEPGFFNISNKEAASMDPQQKIMLEVTWEALEDAGYAGASLAGSRTGVYIGATSGDFPFLGTQAESLNGTLTSHIANRLSYFFNLNGPSMVIDTACSSSLVAIHEACQSILQGESVLAIAGGINIILSERRYRMMCGNSMLSPDGACHTFDRDANGFVPGEGAGIVVLKLLSKAVEDGDTIHLVIKGSAVNNDGRTNGINAPNPQAQTEAIMSAWEKSGINPESLSYIEAHGTGTILGDPIEIAALTNAFRNFTDKTNFCAIGSVKTQIGHLEWAAGVAGLIKIMLAMRHGYLPSNLHFKSINGSIELEKTPLYVLKDSKVWEQGSEPLRAGISSFGAGGTNCHAVVEEWKGEGAPGKPGPEQLKHDLLTLSARSILALKKRVSDMRDFLVSRSDWDAHRVCFSMNDGRGSFDYRATIPVSDHSSVLANLEELSKELEVQGEGLNAKLFGKVEKSSGCDTVLLFPGQGAQYQSMGKQLYEGLFLFKAYFDECDRAMRPYLSMSLVELLFSHTADDNALKETWLTQPVIFAIEYAMAKVWMEMGIKPNMVIGHSIGEYAASCIAGAMELEDACKLVVHRGKLMYEHCAPGSMAAVSASRKVAEEYILLSGAKVSIAAVNANDQVVVSGDRAVVSSYAAFLRAQKIRVSELNVSHGFHSYMMQDMVNHFRAVLQEVVFKKMSIPMISNITGEAVYSVDAEYWLKQIQLPVHFSQGIEWIGRTSCKIFLEAGPGRTLSTLAQKILPDRNDLFFVCSFYRGQNEVQSFMSALGRLYVKGIDINFRPLYKGLNLRRLSLPTYPFERKTYWIKNDCFAESSEKLKLGNSPESIDEWIYYPAWETDVLSGKSNDSSVDTIIFADEEGMAERVTDRLKQLGTVVTMVYRDKKFEKVSELLYKTDENAAEDFEKLIAYLHQRAFKRIRILYFWETAEALIYLIKAIDKKLMDAAIELVAITSGAYTHDESEGTAPYKALVWGVCSVIPHELPNVNCRCIDIRHANKDVLEAELTLLNEILRGNDQKVILRNNLRRVLRWKQVRNADESLQCPPLKHKGTYVITGGLGEIGLEVAGYFAREYKANIALVQRRDFIDERQWAQWLMTHDENDEKSKLIRTLQSLRSKGGDFIIVQADVCDQESMQDAVDTIKQRFGTINGVVHAAGIVKDCLIASKSIESFYHVLQPKIKGTETLDSVLQDENLDFFVLFSSIISVLGNVGQCDYAAANAFLDSYAWNRYAGKKRITKVINWSTWGIGMSGQAATKGHMSKLGLMPMEAAPSIRCFEKALSLPYTQIAIGKFNSTIRSVLSTGRYSMREGWHKEVVASAIERDIPFQAFADEVRKCLGERIGENPDALDSAANFFELGLNSLDLVHMVETIEKKYRIELAPNIFFHYTTIDELTKHIYNSFFSGMVENREKTAYQYEAHEKETQGDTISDKELSKRSFSERDIAVIGVTARFPKADSIEAFWNNLKNGINCITVVQEERWDARRYYSEEPVEAGKTYSKWAGLINGIGCFDPSFFRILPKEARMMDPQQRIMLELSQEVMEQAGYGSSLTRKGEIGVFIGAEPGEYHANSSINAHSAVGGANTGCMIANRISYFLNLNGPSMVIDTACSSSGTAVHLACQSILNQECTMALAGGIKLLLSPKGFVVNSKARMLSPRGICNTFDDAADGYVRGEGAGILLLKPLGKALKDKDTIHAIIKSTAINHDGGHKSGITVPNPKAQKELLLKAWKAADIKPETITYIEAHGTGTPLGDPIEIEGLTEAYREFTDRCGFCAIGSVKPSIGHLEAAAGISGIIKTILALKHKQIPPTLNYKTPNSRVDWGKSPFFVAVELKAWDTFDPPRRAGVNSFGFGGTNVHIVLEEPPEEEKAEEQEGLKLFALSAKTEEALRRKVFDLHRFLLESNSLSSLDISYTLNVGREHYAHRLAFCANDMRELVKQLEGFELKEKPLEHGGRLSKLALDFSSNRGIPDEDIRQLMHFEGFRGAYSECLEIFAYNGLTEEELHTCDTSYRVCVGYCLIKLWKSLGVEPTYCTGGKAGSILYQFATGSKSLRECIEKAVQSDRHHTVKCLETEMAEKKVEDFEEAEAYFVDAFGNISLKSVLAIISELYCKGYDIDFCKMYSEGAGKRVPLPTYPFLCKEYWMKESASIHTYASVEALPVTGSLSDGEYHNIWIVDESYEPPYEATSISINTNRVWIVFDPGEDKIGSICDTLENAGVSLIRVKTGECFRKVSHREFMINPLRHTDYEELFKLLETQFVVLYAWGLMPYHAKPDGWNIISEALDKGFYPLTVLAKAFSSRRLQIEKANLIVLTSLGQPVESSTHISEGAAPMISLAKTMEYELEPLKCKSIDLDFHNTGAEEMVSLLNFEAFFEDQQREVAYYKGKRWIKRLIPIEPPIKDRLELEQDEVFLITGGTGGIGAEVATMLVECGAKRLALAGRSNTPERSEWEDWLKSRPCSREAKIIRLIKQLEYKGAEILLLQADVTDLDEMKKAITRLDECWGRLDGVIHAAGVFDNVNRSLRSKSIDTIKHVLEPKIKGICNLDKLTADKGLRFFLAFSSISSLYGSLGAGQADYSAANAFIDSYAAVMRSRGVNAVSIQWPQWENIGMSEGKSLSKVMSDLGFEQLKSQRAVEILKRLLSNLIPSNVAVFCIKKLEISTEREDRSLLTLNESMAPQHILDKNEISRILIDTIARCTALDQSEIGRECLFRELGMDSLMMVDITGMLEDRLRLKINPAVFFEFLSVGSLAEHLESCSGSAGIEDSDLAESSYVNVLHEVLAKHTGISTNGFEPDVPFGEYGIDSLTIADIAGSLETKLRRPFDPSILIEYPTIRTLNKYLEGSLAGAARQETAAYRETGEAGAMNAASEPICEIKDSEWLKLVRQLQADQIEVDDFEDAIERIKRGEH